MTLDEKLKEIPRSPGVYLMKDSVGRVIYVGKAKTLRSRAGSYFLKGAQAERRTAEAALRDGHAARPSADGLADLLWAVMMTPEFQLIR